VITGLPATFEATMLEHSRQPVQFIHFITSVGTYYLSDKSVGTVEGFEQEYLPWIESWGTLKDSSDISKIFQGGSLEIRSGTINLINSPESRAFIQLLFSLSIENIRVELYQWFSDIPATDAVLIDIMVCQDPIGLSEASMLLSIDIVSAIMINNPYLWAREPGEETRNAVVGKAIGVPLIDMQTARWTESVNDIDYSFVGQLFIRNGVGFPDSGFMYIDSEIVAYNWITAAAINITGRGQQGTIARPHFNGARLTIPGANYDYTICTGPVQLVDNLKGNGEPYVNPVTLLPNQDPVLARFVSRPPWLKISVNNGIPIQPPAETLYSQFGNSHRAEVSSSTNIAIYSGEQNVNSVPGTAILTINNKITTQIEQRIISGNLWSYHNNTTTSSTIYNLMYQPGNGGTLETSRIDSTHYTLPNVWGRIGYTSPNVGDFESLEAEIWFGDAFAQNGDCRCTVQVTGVQSGPMVIDETVLNYDNSYPVSFSFGASVVTIPWSAFNQVAFPYDLLFTFYNTRLNGVNLGAKNTVRIVQITWKYVMDNPSAGTPSVTVLSTYGRDDSHLGGFVSAKASVKLSGLSSGIKDSTIQVITSKSPGWAETHENFDDNNLNLPSRTYGPYSLQATSWAELAAYSCGVHEFITSPEENDFCQSVIEWVKWDITYLPGLINTPDEERIVYADKVTADVTSLLGADPTPAQVIQNMIETYSPAADLLDTVDFEARHQEYLIDQYFLNGVIDGNFQLHDALRKVMFEGSARLLFNEGKIKLLTYVTDEDITVDKIISLDNVLLRSRSIKNEPVSIIKNDVMVIYDQNLENENEYLGRANYTDSASISKFTRQEERLVYDLVHSDGVAQLIGYNTLDGFKQPVSLTYFKVFMPDGYILEKGDRVSIQSFVNTSEDTVGNIVAISRDFGQGKNKKINIYDIAILNFIPESQVADGYGGAGYGAIPYGD